MGNKEKARNFYLENVSDHYQTALHEFGQVLQELRNTVEDTNDHIQWRKSIDNTRLAYKRVEFLLDYYQTKYVYQYINGGPLMKIDEDRRDYPPIPPNGLQTLDEIIYQDEVLDQKDDLLELINKLQVNFNHLLNIEFGREIDEASLLEAMRSGLIRMYTLGLTGFDTPGSANGISESLKTVESLYEFWLLYMAEVESERSSIDRLFRLGKDRLEDGAFETFDRLGFLIDVVDPLYADLRNYRITKDIDLTTQKDHGHNYNSISLFDRAFLKKELYQQFSYAPLDDHRRINLGALLFNDAVLSGNGGMSCATCHQEALAFTDGLAIRDGQTRNSPTLYDVSYSKRYFYDMRAYDLERQVAHVVLNEEEFNTSFSDIEERLQANPNYVLAFREAYPEKDFGEKTISQRSISNALAAYVNSLTTLDSPFDAYVRREVDNIDSSAYRGYNLFMGKAACGTCHFAPIFNGTVPPFYNDSESEVLGVTIGLDTVYPKLDLDPGRIQNGLVYEKLPHFQYSMKTVSVRNSALTSPYMHNGSFNTLQEVLQFYNHGGGAGMGLDVENQTLSPDRLGLSQKELNDIEAFLKSLTSAIAEGD